MRHGLLRVGRVALLIGLLGGADALMAADQPQSTSWFIGLGLDAWLEACAREQEARTVVDDPFMSGRHLSVELGRAHRGQRWEDRLAAEHLVSAAVSFDDGTGLNRTLNRSGSRSSATALDANLWRVWPRSRRRLGLGPVLRLSYEQRTLDYISIETVNRREASLDVGFSMLAEYRIRESLRARIELDNSVVLPWLSYGQVSSAFLSTPIATTRIHSRWTLSASHTWKGGRSIELAYRRDEWVGLDQIRQHLLQLSKLVPIEAGYAHDGCWMLRFGIRR